MTKPKKVEPRVPRMSKDDLRKFVDDLVADRIFTSASVPADLIGSVFLVAALGAFADFSADELDQIGCLYEDLGKRGHWSVNGYPTFISCKILHKDDWEIARKAALAEIERRKNIPL